MGSTLGQALEFNNFENVQVPHGPPQGRPRDRREADQRHEMAPVSHLREVARRGQEASEVSITIRNLLPWGKSQLQTYSTTAIKQLIYF